ncbi:SEL1-like repeat protein [Tropicibacter oceani]|uniref:Tetratricopeptide repeat protein n=1 Tax=Tropicibacter oceani TaxID=3058420 RepID=A0ABY8QQ00_9RHOB|nr:tetratricopeptide repeat protein [Tropicibacter oceani]WGW05907.1 tetratricopeptide repeat protein [Tropicibacter oceani]
MTLRRSGSLKALGLCLCLIPATGLAQQADGWAGADLAGLQSASDQGNPDAQFALADRLHNGDGVLQNYALAAEWLARAAHQGHAAAANRLGQYFHAGLGVEQDRDTALTWLEQAAQTGQAQYLFDLAAVLENGPDGQADPARAAQLYGQAMDLGFGAAAVSLGVLYQHGTGVEKDAARAKTLYEGPATQGDARAQNNLGLLYVRGEGVPQDYDRAFALFTAAAEQGLKVAMGNLGVMYENGFGVAVDEARAAELYRLAARDGQRLDGDGGLPKTVFDPRLVPPDTSPEGLNRLQNGVRAGDPLALFTAGWLILQSDDPGLDDLRQAAGLFRAASEAGNPAAMANLGLMYFEGRALPQDYALGYMWLVLAGTAGFQQALDLSASLSGRMTQAQIAEAQQMAQTRTRP